MKHHAEPDHHGDAGGEQLPKEIGRAACDTKAEPEKRTEEHGDGEHADKPPLLTDRRENEIRVRVRQIAELLLALPDSHTQQLPRPDPGERLLDLPRGFVGRRAGIQEREDPRDPVLRGGDGAEQQRACRRSEHEEVADARAGREQDAAGQHRNEQRHRQVRLEKDQPGHRQENHNERQNTPLEVAQLLTLFRREHRAPHHDGKLGQLRGL